MKLQVLMSTYNGEKYLREQINSILSQTLFQSSDWETELIVRDDGSTDKTCEILEEYSHKFSQIKYSVCENVGVISSFLELIQNTPEDVDFFALADQDDIWMEDKLECAVKALLRSEKSVPLLYCGRCQLVDEKLNPIDGIFFSDNICPAFGNALVENVCTGCTAVFNAGIRDLVRLHTPEFTPMHDWWLYLLATGLGEVVYDTTSHMYYRQHSGNTVGVRKNYVSEFVARVKRFKGNRYQISKQIKSFYKMCEESQLVLEDEKMQMVQDVLGAKKSIKKRFDLFFNKRIYRQRKGDDIIFRLIMLSGTM